MRIRDEYLHGSDLTGVVKKIEVTTGTGKNANKSVIKYTKADSTDSVVEVPIGNITGTAESASKLDNTSAIGSKINPVYFTEKGVPSACIYSLNATVPIGTKNEILYYTEANTLDTLSYTTLTSNLDIFTEATENAAGKKGLVPAPTANQLGDGNFFLRADGVWTVIESKSAALNGIDTSLVTTGEKYNWNSAYNWYNSMTSGDTDGIINKWKEVESFLANYGESSTLAAELAKLVTLSTLQTITGVKTFSEVINGSITGNAGTADKLKNAIIINGVTFDGSADITITANPNSHSHGNITNEGAIGIDANKPIITTTNGVLTTGAFGTTANTFCEGNDSRLSDARKNPNALTLGALNGSGEVVGENTLYDGSSALSFKVKAGSGITLSQDTKGEVVITNSDNNTDTKVRLTETDGTSIDRYIPFPGTSISSGFTYELYYQSDFKYNPGTKLFSVPNISISSTSNLGIISSGEWQGSPIANNYIANPQITINGTSVTLGESIVVTATAAGGNADTVGGYSPSDFLLRTEHETFESVIATALADLDNRKIEASDIPTSLPANGGNADTASKWETSRKITLTGSVTGEVSIDGSEDVSLNTTTNHTHTTSQITDFPTNVSAFTNDAGYLTSNSLNNYVTLNTSQTITGVKIFAHDTFTLDGIEYSDIKHATQQNYNWGGYGYHNTTPIYTGMYNSLDFLWYGDTWSIGNLRSSGNSTNGFGIGLKKTDSNGNLYFAPALRITETESYINNNKIWHAGNLTKVSQLTNDAGYLTDYAYSYAITLNANSAKALIKDNWSIDDLSIYLTSNGAYSGTSLAAGTYALWIEDRESASGTPNYYSGTFTCAGNAAAGRLDEIALHSSMATSADTNAPTRIFVATLISNTSGKHVLRFCSLDSSATNHYLTVKVNRII